MHTARLTVTGPRRPVIRRSLDQETAPRAGIIMQDHPEREALDIVITADSAAHLRAACNSFLQWIDLVERMGEAVESPP
ncbi:MAG: KEOPS complex subunit Pcc1 [Candidatus Thermoplasmatota archaeon]|nr:KEOPS complex subunit Pcc1 [Candidatus Thermoplasmatota archaeon]MDD5778757.1 KEOPS complex subunit Pcc1 [Candidatus Thermoplasmatota archaeon]